MAEINEDTKNDAKQAPQDPKRAEAKVEDMPPWIQPMALKLGAIHSKYVQACSISIVREELRKLKEEAYMPKIVSIGPLHNGTRTDLQYMEEIKWRCMLDLLKRSKINEVEMITKCSEAILSLDQQVRASYNVNLIEFNSHELAKIMVLDGCFLLELLLKADHISKGSKQNSNDPSPAAKVIKREDVLSDLVMLENQIPLLVLNTLYRTLFPEVFKGQDVEKIIHDVQEVIHNLVLSLLGYTQGSNFDRVSDFIGIVHGSFTGEKEITCVRNTAGSDKIEDIEGNKNKDSDVTVASDEDAELKVKRCITKLHAAGIKIIPPNKPSAVEANLDLLQILVQKLKEKHIVRMFSRIAKMRHVKRNEQRELVKNDPAPKEIKFDLNVRINDGTLEIPQLHITKTTEYKWRNLIAWEVNRTVKEKFIGFQEGETRTECKFIWYAWFFQSLICCVHDIQLLRDKNVIVVHEFERNKEKGKKAMSNEDLLNFFRELTKGIPNDLNYRDSHFTELFNKLNSHPSARDRATKTRIIAWHIFRCYVTGFRYFCREEFLLLIREHIPTGWKLIAVLAATAGLALTAAQTHYSAQG